MTSNRPTTRKLQAYHRRAYDRDDCDLATTMSHGPLLNIPAQVVNIAPEGCCVRARHDCQRNDRVRILLPILGDYEARVAWSLQGVFGCAFTLAIDNDVYCRVLAAIKTGRESWPRP